MCKFDTAPIDAAPTPKLFGVQHRPNQMGHGFYEFNPELFYRALSPSYGVEGSKLNGCCSGTLACGTRRMILKRLIPTKG